MRAHVKAYGVVPYLIRNNSIKILLCCSVASKDKWGALKGSKNKNETAYECAKREFIEECSLHVETGLFENYFEQINIDKDVGVWLVNADNIEDLEKFFDGDTLKSNYLSWENSKVKFFSLNDLPRIKNKQVTLIKEITDFLKSKSLFR
jgi:ADP-ribose pyrophosphatase YjhB (NUDIX family)